MKKTILISLLATVLALPVFAWDGHGKWMSKLDLTSEQKQQMKEIRQAKKAEMKANKEQRKAIHKRKQALMENYSEAEAEAIADDVAKMAKEKVLNRLAFTQKMLGILNPEQQQAFKKMMAKRGDRKGHHGKCHHGKKHDWSED